jgi:hypothetical protein
VESQEQAGPDLWSGVERLLLISHGAHLDRGRDLKRVLRVVDAKGAPPALRQLALTLNALVTDHGSQK